MRVRISPAVLPSGAPASSLRRQAGIAPVRLAPSLPFISGCGPRARPSDGVFACPRVFAGAGRSCCLRASRAGAARPASSFACSTLGNCLAVEVGKPARGSPRGLAGELLVERVMSAGLVDHNKAVAAVAVGEYPSRGPASRRANALPLSDCLEAVENGVADFPHVGSEPAAFLKFVAVGVARPVVRLAVVASPRASRNPFRGCAQSSLSLILKRPGSIARIVSRSTRNHATCKCLSPVSWSV